MEPVRRLRRPIAVRTTAEQYRRGPWAGATAFAAVAVLAVGCGASDMSDSVGVPRAEAAPGSPTQPGAELPTGWRWESFRGVQVGVPADWGYDNGSQRTSQWCVERGGDRSTPVVGRPGPSTLAGCVTQDPGGPDPGTLLANGGTLVAFSEAPARGPARVTEGDRTTVVVAGVTVMVQARQSLRERILDTIHTVEVDANGCPVDHPISKSPSARPSPAVDVTSLRGVTAVAACKYAISANGTEGTSDRPSLLSSLKLTDDAARVVVDAIAAAPPGGGPNAPLSCAADISYGDEIMVLMVDSAQGRVQLYMRYSGCDHNGFDDGVVERRLTAAAASPLVAGPNLVFGFSDSGNKSDILWPKS